MKTRMLAVLAALMLVLPFTGVMAQDQNIVEIAAGDENFSTLVSLVEAAGLVETLSGEGPFTVFAPTNDAFQALADDLGVSLEDLAGVLTAEENAGLLTTILTYHVVPASVTSDMVESGQVDTVEGSPLTLSVSDMGVMVNHASVVTPDLMASNGVIHVIDGVVITLPNDPLAVSGDIAEAGSSTVFPLAERMKDQYEEAGYADTLTIDSIGSGAGFERFCEQGASDISNASRAIRDTEVEACESIGRSPIEFRVGTDALAVVVSEENDFVENVTIEDLQLIFGAAETWADVNPDWPAEPIQRFIPGTDSGTFDYFVEEIFDEDESQILANDPTTSENDNVLVEGIQGSPFAIGFFGYAYYAENTDILKSLSIEGVEANAANVDNGEYPLARPLFIYSTASIMAEKPQVADFIAFFLSDVNDYVVEVGYFPANPEALYQARLKWIAATLGLPIPGGM